MSRTNQQGAQPQTRVGAQAAPGISKDELAGQASSLLQNIMSLVQELNAEIGSAGSSAPAGAPAPGQAQMGAGVEQPGSGPGAEGYRSETAPPNHTQSVDEEGDYQMKAPDGSDHVVRMKKSAAKALGCEKALITGSPDASTGISSAEERQGDLPEWDDQNLDEITKGLLALFSRAAVPAGVQRQAPAASFQRSLVPVGPEPASSTDHLLLQVTKALSSFAERMKSQDIVLKDILEGLGVAKELEGYAPPAAPQKPVGSLDSSAVAKEFLNAIVAAAGGSAQVAVGEKPVEQVHKNLCDFVTTLRQAAVNEWGA